MDGTFESCPRLFTQIFVVHGAKNKLYVPLAYCLLKDKKKTSYAAALRHLAAHLPADYEPTTTFSDFEDGIRWAVKQVWPNTTLRGCRFHLGQTWFRKIQGLGLQPLYRKKSEEGSFLRAFFGLAFLQPEKIEECLTEDFGPRAPDNDNYILSTYVEGGATYPPEMWAGCCANAIRTTNICEGFNAQLNGMFYHGHPHIFKLLDALLEMQDFVYIKMKSQAKVTENDDRENFLQEQFKAFEEQEITQFEFIKRISRKFLPKKV